MFIAIIIINCNFEVTNKNRSFKIPAMKKFVYLILISLTSTFQSCKQNDPPVDFTTNLVGEYEIKYVIKDAKTENFLASDSLISAVATVTFVKKDNNTLIGEVYIDDPRIKINETFEALVGKDPDPVDYMNLPVSEGELDEKYLVRIGSLMTTLYLYKNKKIVAQLGYSNSMGNRWFSFK